MALERERRGELILQFLLQFDIELENTDHSVSRAPQDRANNMVVIVMVSLERDEGVEGSGRARGRLSEGGGMIPRDGLDFWH